jgi:hypothetical protein
MRAMVFAPIRPRRSERLFRPSVAATLVALAAALLVAPVLGARAEAPTPEDERVLVEWPDGRSERSASFAIEPGAAGGFAPLRIVTLAPRAEPRPGNSTAVGDARVQVTLWNGDRVAGRSAPGLGDAEHVGLLVGGSGDLALRLPIDVLARLDFPGRASAAGTEELTAPEEGDRLYRLAGTGVDVLDGTLDGFDERGLVFESRLGLRSYGWNEVVALFVEPIDPPDSTRGLERAVALDLVGGGRLHGLLDAFDGTGYRLRLPWDEVVVAPLESVLVCSTDDGRLAYLSDRDPDAVAGGSAFGDDLGLVFEPLRDRAVHGEALRAGGRTWPRGIGVQAPMSLAFELERGAFDELRGLVAIDASTADLGARGAVVFVIRGDGEELWRSEIVRGGRPPVELPVLDVSEVARLELVVEMGPDLNLGDRADWLDVRLVRSQG